jgi:ABC-type transport system substrate-binding protein
LPLCSAEEPLYRQDPFDRIILNDQNGNAVIEVAPLGLPGRIVPKSPPPEERLFFHLVDQPDKTYAVQWQEIAKVELFEQIVLDEALQLAVRGKGDLAYDYFRFLFAKYPKLVGLEPAYGDFLYEEAKRAGRDKNFSAALAMLRELHDRQPARPGLDKALGLTTERLLEQYAAAQDYPAARRLLLNLATMYPQEPTVARWRAQLKQVASLLFQAARASFAAGEFGKADDAVRRLAQVWPELPGARELAQSLHQKYPRVVVGVSAAAGDMDASRIDDWASRRSIRLVYRELAELADPGPQGGRYVCPVGSLELDPKRQQLTVKLSPGLHWSDREGTLSSYDVARRLLAMSTEGDPQYRGEWAELLGDIEVGDAATLFVRLSRPHLRPEALLQTILLPSAGGVLAERGSSGPDQAYNGPYAPAPMLGDEAVFRIGPGRTAADVRGPREIAERPFREMSKAVAALRRGEIEVLDRVNPWDIAALRTIPGVKVEAYRMPLVHCLIPNPSRPLAAQGSVRRALVYAIDRQAILHTLTGGAELPGCQVVSGPFLAPNGDVKAARSADEETIAPRAYDPRLAAVLLRDAAAHAATGLVLAYPPEPIARTACAAIRRQLQIAGVRLELRELVPGAASRPAADVDLVYAELAVWEPLVDARRVLGEDGLTGGCSPAMSLALRQLAEAADWQQVAARLRTVHRLADQEAAVIPLWQLTDHCAYREQLKGVGSQPISLYENVEQWTVDFFYPSGQPR